jgi:antitoxin HigA-1
MRNKRVVINQPASVEDTIKEFGMSKARVKKVNAMVKKIKTSTGNETRSEDNEVAPAPIKRLPVMGMKPTSVGEMITEEFLKPLEMSVESLAFKMGVSPLLLNGIMKGSILMEARDAIALGNAFGNSPEFWLNVRNANDLYAVQQANKKR